MRRGSRNSSKCSCRLTSLGISSQGNLFLRQILAAGRAVRTMMVRLVSGADFSLRSTISSDSLNNLISRNGSPVAATNFTVRASRIDMQATSVIESCKRTYKDEILQVVKLPIALFQKTSWMQTMKFSTKAKRQETTSRIENNPV